MIFFVEENLSGYFSVETFLGVTGAGVWCSMQWSLDLDAH